VWTHLVCSNIFKIKRRVRRKSKGSLEFGHFTFFVNIKIPVSAGNRPPPRSHTDGKPPDHSGVPRAGSMEGGFDFTLKA
jgi:hypothetical protein